MTINGFRDLMLSVDPAAKKWKGAGGDQYTVWSPYRPKRLISNGDTVEGGYHIQVDRYTKNPEDPMIEAITQALSGKDDISFETPDTDYEQDTGYFHFIWDCEVV